MDPFVQSVPSLVVGCIELQYRILAECGWTVAQWYQNEMIFSPIKPLKHIKASCVGPLAIPLISFRGVWNPKQGKLSQNNQNNYKHFTQLSKPDCQSSTFWKQARLFQTSAKQKEYDPVHSRQTRDHNHPSHRPHGVIESALARATGARFAHKSGVPPVA